jgi:hypothetical protein
MLRPVINEEKPKVDLQVVDGGSSSKSGTNGGVSREAEGRERPSTRRPLRGRLAQGERKVPIRRDVSTEAPTDYLERDNGFEPSTFSLGS